MSPACFSLSLELLFVNPSLCLWIYRLCERSSPSDPGLSPGLRSCCGSVGCSTIADTQPGGTGLKKTAKHQNVSKT